MQLVKPQMTVTNKITSLNPAASLAAPCHVLVSKLHMAVVLVCHAMSELINTCTQEHQHVTSLDNYAAVAVQVKQTASSG